MTTAFCSAVEHIDDGLLDLAVMFFLLMAEWHADQFVVSTG
jgi:hypothetical protein